MSLNYFPAADTFFLRFKLKMISLKGGLFFIPKGGQLNDLAFVFGMRYFVAKALFAFLFPKKQWPSEDDMYC